MKTFILFLTFLINFSAFAECVWSVTEKIANLQDVHFRECSNEGKLRIGEIELSPNIAFNIINASWPEGNTLWASRSPDGVRLAVVLHGPEWSRNAWVLNMASNKVEFFDDSLIGRHYSIEFISDDTLSIRQAGTGYKNVYQYKLSRDNWILQSE